MGLRERMIVDLSGVGVRVARAKGTNLVPYLVSGIRGSFSTGLTLSDLQSAFGRILASDEEPIRVQEKLRQKKVLPVKNRHGRFEQVFTDQVKVRKL